MCEIKLDDIRKIEHIMFRFLWNNKWTGNIAPDRIKRSFMKKSHENGGLNVLDIKILDNALKTKQFIRGMICGHPISLIQKHLMEKIGYYEYYKNEYSKICKRYIVIKVYQETVNCITNRICQGGEHMEAELAKKARINLIASTDILEYFQRKNIPLVIYRFRELVNLGIETFHELVNESTFPRSDRYRACAREIISFFPAEWLFLLQNADKLDGELTFEHQFPSYKYYMTPLKNISVKGLRVIQRESLPLLPMPYLNAAKFELNNIYQLEHNPFILIRSALHAPRDKFYKYRVLHGDIFFNSCMFKFKMVNSPNCSICTDTVETVKHLLWDCPRSARIWSYLNNTTRVILGREYINYNVIVLGNPNPIMAMETMIVWALKIITSIDRSQMVESESIFQKFKTL